MPDFARMLEGVKPEFFPILPLEFCLQFLVLPVEVTEEEIHVMGRQPLAPHVLLYIQRITGRTPVPVPLSEDQEERLLGHLSLLVQKPEILSTTESLKEQLLSLFRAPPLFGPACWKAVRDLNLSLGEARSDEAWRSWVSVLPGPIVSIAAWGPEAGLGWETRVRIDAEPTVRLLEEKGTWRVLLTTGGESMEALEFNGPSTGDDRAGDGGMSLGRTDRVLVASFQDRRRAHEVAGLLESLLDAARHPAGFFGYPPELWR